MFMREIEKDLSIDPVEVFNELELELEHGCVYISKETYNMTEEEAINMILPDYTPEQEYSSDSNASLSALEDAIDKVMKNQKEMREELEKENRVMREHIEKEKEMREQLERKLDYIVKKISSDEEEYVSRKKRRFCLIEIEADDTPSVN